MREFKVGTRVIGKVDASDSIIRGKSGTIIRTKSATTPTYVVEFDEPNPHFHSNQGNGKQYHCWWANHNDIKSLGNPHVPELEIDRVIFSNPATIVFFEDGTKAVAKCHPDDVYDEHAGIAVAIAKRMGYSMNYIDSFVPKVEVKGKSVRFEDIKVGDKYRVVKNRESYYGDCYDLIQIEGQIVTVTDVDDCDNILGIASANNTHCCEAVNLERI